MMFKEKEPGKKISIASIRLSFRATSRGYRQA